MHYLFDMDGVLVNSGPVIRRAALEALRSYGVLACEEDFRPFVGAGEARFVGGVAEKYGVPYEPAMKDKTYEIYLQYVAEGLVVYPNTKKVLQELTARGDTVSLASSADFIKVEANMKTAGIPLELFATIISGDDAARKKPFPDIFTTAIERLGVSPAQCLVVEDAVSGAIAGKRGGMQVACVGDASAERAGDYNLTSFAELMEIAG